MGDAERVTIDDDTEIRMDPVHGDNGTARVFLSVASVTASSDQAVVDLVTGVLDEQGFEVVRVRRDDYRQDRHLLEVREAMAACSGVVVVGLPQLLVESGVWRQGTDDERTLTREHLHTPWNDIETGLGIGLGLPVLAIRMGCAQHGVFALPPDDVGFENVDLTGRWAREVLVEGVRRWAAVALRARPYGAASS